ncbi:hypothetical protein DCC81_03630 [Chitinophaga parva]|uniref:Uncharacterized protein n=1 Tax=Chitinophaga parva TaxID=2169414 RepID=A0A2T7BLM4_9BACT|nr:hypothetical protein [Chitinophaga parva]PUZ28584.1 hypothetical protein DCC81_03630 [Chitinophaga parva]
MKTKSSKNALQEPSAAQQLLHQTGHRLQQRWAGYMGAKTAHWDRHNKLLFLAAICLIGGGMSTAVFVNALRPKPASTRQQRPAETIAPAPLYLPRLIPTGKRDSAVFGRFHHLVDSLRTTPAGRLRLQRYLDKHPGLLDSIAYIEQGMH